MTLASGLLAIGFLVGTPGQAQAWGSGSAAGGICLGGWAWSSWYSNGYNNASTTETGSKCGIGAQVRAHNIGYNRVNGNDYVLSRKYGQMFEGGIHHLGAFSRAS